MLHVSIPYDVRNGFDGMPIEGNHPISRVEVVEKSAVRIIIEMVHHKKFPNGSAYDRRDREYECEFR